MSSRWGRSVLPDGYAVSSAVRRTARHLEVLRSFVWDGEELPPYDDMWFALRISCVPVLIPKTDCSSSYNFLFFILLLLLL